MHFCKSLLFGVLCSIVVISACAKKGIPNGGPVDIDAPKIVMSNPDNGTTNFKGNEVEIYFDEYVSLKDIDKQLIISPPQKYKPVIKPLGGVSKKYITIQIKDTLQPNTTYSFNFGNSIVDATEGNPYKNLKYIFSTGDYIDSLQVSGTVKDAYLKELTDPVSVFLYEVDTEYTDSIIFTETPRYVATTDSTNAFVVENIKEGQYQMIAVTDKNENYKFNSLKEKIGYHSSIISVPTNESFEVNLFKEIATVKGYKPKQVSNNKLIMGYRGNIDSLKVSLTQRDSLIQSYYTYVPKKDSVSIWYPPSIQDSMLVRISNNDFEKEYKVKVREKKEQDSLAIKSLVSGTLHFRDIVKLQASTPIEKSDVEKINLYQQDSIPVDYSTKLDKRNKELAILFEKTPETRYKLVVLPDAVEDFFGLKNKDTLRFKFETRELSDYGNLNVEVKNAKKFPILIEVANNDGEVIASDIIRENRTVVFEALGAAKYQLRAIYDDNDNGKWDTGSFLQKTQPEEVYYYPKLIDVRMNWDINQPFDLSTY